MGVHKLCFQELFGCQTQQKLEPLEASQPAFLVEGELFVGEERQFHRDHHVVAAVVEAHLAGDLVHGPVADAHDPVHLCQHSLYARVGGKVFVHLLDGSVVFLEDLFGFAQVLGVFHEPRVPTQLEVIFEGVFQQPVRVFFVGLEDRRREVEPPLVLHALWRHVRLASSARQDLGLRYEIPREEWLLCAVKRNTVHAGYCEHVVLTQKIKCLCQLVLPLFLLMSD